MNPLITFGAFSPTDYADVSSQSCSLTVESNLSTVSSALQGTVLAASAVCSALPPIASNVCWAVAAGFSVADAVSFGLFADCSEQDGNVNAAEIDAGFHNTVTIYNALGTDFTTLNSNVTGVNTNLTNVNNAITGEFNTNATNLVNYNAAITNEFNANNTHLTNVNTAITNEFNAATTQLTNVDTHVSAEFTALATQLVALVNQLSNQVGNGTALADAELRQVMKLLLTPDGQKKIDPPILTCNGTNCPNVLAACPAAGCSWNNVGPLP